MRRAFLSAFPSALCQYVHPGRLFASRYSLYRDTLANLGVDRCRQPQDELPMPIALTTSGHLIDEANKLTERGVLASPSDFKIRQLKREADKLIKASPAEGYSVMAIVSVLSGEADEAVRMIENAIRLDRNPVFLMNKSVILGNLGLFSASQDVFKQLTEPLSEAWPNQVVTGLNCGAFCTVAALMRRAEKMTFGDIQDMKPEAIYSLAAILEASGITEREVAGYLDIAGEIMREERLIFIGAAHIQIVPSYEDGIHISFKLGVDAFKAEDLDSELASRIAARHERLFTRISIGFESGLPEHERYPAGSLEALAAAI
jgi:hypothetical protein